MRFQFLLLFSLCQMTLAAIYEIGPQRELSEIDQAPWHALKASDTVLIHWRAEPYRTKWVVNAVGTESAPVTIRGVPSADGKLPVISGENAVTLTRPYYRGHQRAIVKITPTKKNQTPAYVVIENLEFKSARPPYSYMFRGQTIQYLNNATTIWVENGQHITIRNCTLHDASNGLFVSHASRDVIIERCRIFDNGMENRFKEHNVYTAANGITFRFNYMGPLRTNCPGNNLRDRSAGTIVYCNWIEGGWRQLDLVDAEDAASLRADPKYHTTTVCGNVIVQLPGKGTQIVHYGGDSGHTSWYRKGVLYFYNNTVISLREKPSTLFRLQTKDETVDCRNNIIWSVGSGGHMAIVDSVGKAELTDNWFKKGWVKCHEKLEGTVSDKNTLTGFDPGFVNEKKNDFHLAPDSPCIKAGKFVTEAMPVPLNDEYVVPKNSQKRGDVSDIGAFQR